MFWYYTDCTKHLTRIRNIKPSVKIVCTLKGIFIEHSTTNGHIPGLVCKEINYRPLYRVDFPILIWLGYLIKAPCSFLKWPMFFKRGKKMPPKNVVKVAQVNDFSFCFNRAGAGEVLLGRDDHNSFRENQIDNEEQVIESEINKFKTVDSNQDFQEIKAMITISESETRDAKDLPTTEVSSLSLSALPTQERLKSITDKRHFISTKEMRQDTRKETYSKDAIVQSVQAVFQEWCTQSTLEWLGFCVNTKVQSSFSEEMVKGGYFLLKQ